MAQLWVADDLSSGRIENLREEGLQCTIRWYCATRNADQVASRLGSALTAR